MTLLSVPVVNLGPFVTPNRAVNVKTLEDMRWQLRYGITDELGSSAPVDGSENNTLWRKGLELIDELLTLEQIEACLDKNEYDVEQFITFFRLIDFSERVTVVSRSQT